MSWKLTEKSPTIGQPNGLVLPLMNHQLAMFYKCLSIERGNEQLGFMADKAGAGKTAVIISLILTDKIMFGKTCNLIIVPQNIISQWMSEIEKFTGACGTNVSLSVKLFTEYSDVSTLAYNNKILKKYDILITTESYYPMVTEAIKHHSIVLDRLIYDEVDTMNIIAQKYQDKIKMLENQELKDKAKSKRNGYEYRSFIPKSDILEKPICKITWFVSASIHNLIDDEKNVFVFGGITTSTNTLGNIMVKCDNTFIQKSQKSFNIKDPVYKNIICESVMDTFSEFLDVKELDYINSLGVQNIYNKNTMKRAVTDLDAMNIIIDNYNHIIDENTKSLRDINSTLESLNETLDEADDTLKEKVDILQKDINLYTDIISIIYDHCRNDNEHDNNNIEIFYEKINYIKNTMENIDSKIKNKKLLVISNTIDDIFTKKNNPKLLIFSDFSESFKPIIELLTDKNIKYTELNKGNIKEIKKAISDYKEGDTNVLLIDSASSVAGTNLENSTHILFIHRINETLTSQMVGRGNRPGRVGELNVVNFYNKNEVV